MCVCVCVCARARTHVYIYIYIYVCILPMSLRIKIEYSRTQYNPIGLCILRSGDFCAARNEDSVPGTVTTLWDGRSKNLGANSGRDKNVSLFQNDQTGPRTHTASCSVGTGDVPPGQSDCGVKLTIHHIYYPN